MSATPLQWAAAHIGIDDPEQVETLRAVLFAVWERAVGSLQYEDGSPVEIVSNDNPYRRKS